MYLNKTYSIFKRKDPEIHSVAVQGGCCQTLWDLVCLPDGIISLMASYITICRPYCVGCTFIMYISIMNKYRFVFSGTCRFTCCMNCEIRMIVVMWFKHISVWPCYIGLNHPETHCFKICYNKTEWNIFSKCRTMYVHVCPSAYQYIT